MFACVTNNNVDHAFTLLSHYVISDIVLNIVCINNIVSIFFNCMLSFNLFNSIANGEIQLN